VEDLETIEILVADPALAVAKTETEARCLVLSVVNVVEIVKFLSAPMAVSLFFVALASKHKVTVADQVEMEALVTEISRLTTGLQ
jgi:hypothetical protein